MRLRALLAVVGAVALASCSDPLSPAAAALGCYRMDYASMGSGWPPVTNLVRLRRDTLLKAYFPGRMVSPNPDPAGLTPLGSWSMPDDNTLLLSFLGVEMSVSIRVTRFSKSSALSTGEPDFVGSATFVTDVTPGVDRPATLTRDACRD